MTDLRVPLEDDALTRLQRRADREGVTIDMLASKLLTAASQQDPYEFIGSFSSGLPTADRVDEALAELGFGR